MTIEIARGKIEYIYRLNPYQNCCIDRRINRHGARWQHYKRLASPFEALEELLAIRNSGDEDNHD